MTINVQPVFKRPDTHRFTLQKKQQQDPSLTPYLTGKKEDPFIQLHTKLPPIGSRNLPDILISRNFGEEFVNFAAPVTKAQDVDAVLKLLETAVFEEDPMMNANRKWQIKDALIGSMADQIGINETIDLLKPQLPQ